ncbi:MAG: hypothetical protein JSV45_09930 [Chromatiales bacterium]|nr:MAG: hypothetical protein JSV45_09930 [Chromatiales bacterium]
MSTPDRPRFPDRLAQIEQRGFVTWSEQGRAWSLADRFDARRIPVAGIRHVRVWGLQVDDERELPGHERTSIPDEELWQVVLVATDGSHYEVNSDLVEPAPE